MILQLICKLQYWVVDREHAGGGISGFGFAKGLPANAWRNVGYASAVNCVPEAMKILLFAALLVASAMAQTPAFDVVSVKPLGRRIILVRCRALSTHRNPGLGS
jgi:hypothetical protein